MNRLVFAATLALTAMGGIAHARPALPFDAPEPSQTVRYDDLDTSSPTGARRLAFRIRVAARVVCGGNDPVIVTGVGFDDCVNHSVARAAAQLGNPLVDAALRLPPDGLAYAHR